MPMLKTTDGDHKLFKTFQKLFENLANFSCPC